MDHSENLEKEFLRQLFLQITSYMKKSGSDYIKTTYIGGGTPSMLSHSHLRDLFDFLNPFIDAEVQEFTMECNPEDVSIELISLLSESPVNRISLGVQSFDPYVLQKSGRESRPGVIENAISIIKEHWKGRFSIDIITGLPGQTLDGQKDDIEKAISSGVDHISCYSLILEENTPLFDNQDIIPNEEDEDMMWSQSNEILINNGFSHYEVSNYSRTGYESRHNMQYWKMNEYIGCGPGAVSMIYDGGVIRISNPQDVSDFSEGIVEKISPFDFLFENYMMGLRTDAGIDRQEFFRRFGSYPEKLIKNTIELEKEDTFTISKTHFFLSDKSRLFMNSLLMKIYDELSLNTIDFEVNWP